MYCTIMKLPFFRWIAQKVSQTAVIPATILIRRGYDESGFAILCQLFRKILREKAGRGGRVPPPRTCPSTRPQISDYVAEYEQDPVTWKLASISGETTMHDHGETRMQQVVRFAKAYGCRKIGLAFCISLSEEARMTANVLRKEGFEVESVICKVGRFDRKCVGVNDPRL